LRKNEVVAKRETKFEVWANITFLNEDRLDTKEMQSPCKIDVSVLICTWNRASLLQKTLESLFSMNVPTTLNWEVVVVDNNCSDNTKEVIFEFLGKYNIKYVFEKQAGHSFARNTAVASSEGQIIVWTDDDVRVDANWLTNLLQCHDDLSADVVFGKVTPLWEKEAPSWFSRRFDGRFALLDLGEDQRITKTESGFGVNHSVKRKALESIGCFRTDLGIRPIKAREKSDASLTAGGGEDSFFFERAHSLGLCVAYCGAAVVQHFIPNERCKKVYYRRRVWNARGQHLITLSTSNVPICFGVPRDLLRKFIGDFFRYFGSLLTFRQSDAFYYELQLLGYIGLVDAARRAKKMIAK
jgi:glycosyltransferase involved in cell wall biosynthesis